MLVEVGDPPIVEFDGCPFLIRAQRIGIQANTSLLLRLWEGYTGDESTIEGFGVECSGDFEECGTHCHYCVDAT